MHGIYKLSHLRRRLQSVQENWCCPVCLASLDNLEEDGVNSVVAAHASRNTLLLQHLHCQKCRDQVNGKCSLCREPMNIVVGKTFTVQPSEVGNSVVWKSRNDPIFVVHVTMQERFVSVVIALKSDLTKNLFYVAYHSYDRNQRQEFYARGELKVIMRSINMLHVMLNNQLLSKVFLKDGSFEANTVPLLNGPSQGTRSRTWRPAPV